MTTLSALSPKKSASTVPTTIRSSLGKSVWLSSIVGGAIAFLTSIAAQWLIYDYFLGGDGLRLIGAIATALAVALFVKHLRQTERKNRLADLRRFAVIGEMNHHIRNALQVLAYGSSPDNPSSERAKQAIKRIEWVLREVLPSVRDEADEWNPQEFHEPFVKNMNATHSRSISGLMSSKEGGSKT